VAENQDDEENVVETEKASAGGPNTHDSANTRLRAETPPPLPEELDRRQERMRSTRRSGGPNLSKKAPSRRDANAEEQADDVPPTETGQPPGPPTP
jgi:hypothetical protein